MAEQRRKGPGRKGRPASHGGKTRSGRPARGARTRQGGPHGPRTVIPSNRWRPMRRVGGSSGRLEEPSPSGRPTQAAEQETEQTPPRHGVLGRLFQR